jgi:hypothetical protein
MRQKSRPAREPAEQVVKDIRRATRHWTEAMPGIGQGLPQTRCAAIFVVGYLDGRDACFRLK